MAAKQAKKPGTAVAVKERAEVATNDANLPSFLKGFKGPTGAENIDRDDITIPRIKIGQDMSQEVQDGNLERGDLFLNVSGEKLVDNGKPLRIVVLATAKEYILWRPRKDNGGGILARARKVKVGEGYKYEWDKPNQSFDVKIEGKTKVTWKTKTYIEEDGLGEWGSEIPGDKDSGIAATAHHNYVVILVDNDDAIAALSLARSGAKKAKDFNALLKMGRGPMAARVYQVVSVKEKKDTNEFHNVKITPDGFVTEEQYRKYAAIAESYTGRSINVDHSDGPEETDDRA